MTEHEAKDMLQAKLICLELDSDVEGCDGDCEGCEYNYTQGTFREQKEALKAAIKALEKQIAKKPIQDDGYYCPFCNNRVAYAVRGYKQPYCMECGQKLDWSVEE